MTRHPNSTAALTNRKERSASLGLATGPRSLDAGRNAVGTGNPSPCERRLRTIGIRLPPWLQREVDAFLSDHPTLARRDDAVGACAWVSREFVDRIDGAEVVHLLGSRVRFPRRAKYWRHYPQLDPDLYHVIVRVHSSIYIDFTRRQFEPRGIHPFVQGTDEVRRDWRHVTKRPLI